MNNGGKPRDNSLFTIAAGLTIAVAFVDLGEILFRREILSGPMLKLLWFGLSIVLGAVFAPLAGRRLAGSPGIRLWNSAGSRMTHKRILGVFVVICALFSFLLIERFQLQFVENPSWNALPVPFSVAVIIGVLLYWHYIWKPEKEAHE